MICLLSIEKTREGYFVLVREVDRFGVIVRSFPHITRCRLYRCEDLMEHGAAHM